MECRTPLSMKVDVPPPPPPPGGLPPSSSTPETYHKENNQPSPALQRRQQLVQHRYGRHPQELTPPKPPPQSIKQRLPLPKNAVLLSLIQASEPARRRANVDSPPDVPPKINRESSTERFSVLSPSSNMAYPPTTPPTTKSSSLSRSGGASRSGGTSGTPTLLPKFSKSAALFVDTGLNAPSSSSEYQMDEDDIEEHQIRVGTYLEGGPCGTYAVAVKTGLLVYPTLFEHALPNKLGTSNTNSNNKDDNSSASQPTADQQPDQWKRDVDELVKSNFWKKQQLQQTKQQQQQQNIQADKKTPTKRRSANVSSILFEGDEWHTEASVDNDNDVVEKKQQHSHSDIGIGMRLSTSLSHESRENRDDVYPGSSSSLSYSHDGSIHGGETFDDSNLNRSLPLTNTMTFTRQLSVPISPPRAKGDSCDEFDRPLIRLKYGDRVQVVSMDSKGWVKLARGYGYIRLQNDKQLVKVGGTSDRACQIEATLHELSIERDRLKHEQTKLERLSAGLMIDLQSTLLTSDDHVICSAPEGMPRIDSDWELSTRHDKKQQQQQQPSLDDISVTARSPKLVAVNTARSAISDIRMSKSYSPSRSARGANHPPSPPPTDPRLSTPTRVNFRTGMSGHRALMSSNTHPHDFIGTPGSMRSMSNHSGISRGKKPTRPRASIY